MHLTRSSRGRTLSKGFLVTMKLGVKQGDWCMKQQMCRQKYSFLVQSFRIILLT